MTTPNKDPMVERIVEEQQAMLSSAFTIRSTGLEQTQQENVVRQTLQDWLRATLLRFKEEVEGEMKAKILKTLPFWCVACGKELEFGSSTSDGERRGCYDKECPRVKENNYYYREMPYEVWSAYERIRTLLSK